MNSQAPNESINAVVVTLHHLADAIGMHLMDVAPPEIGLYLDGDENEKLQKANNEIKKAVKEMAQNFIMTETIDLVRLGDDIAYVERVLHQMSTALKIAGAAEARLGRKKVAELHASVATGKPKLENVMDALRADYIKEETKRGVYTEEDCKKDITAATKAQELITAAIRNQITQMAISLEVSIAMFQGAVGNPTNEEVSPEVKETEARVMEEARLLINELNAKLKEYYTSGVEKNTKLLRHDALYQGLMAFAANILSVADIAHELHKKNCAVCQLDALREEERDAEQQKPLGPIVRVLRKRQLPN